MLGCIKLGVLCKDLQLLFISVFLVSQHPYKEAVNLYSYTVHQIIVGDSRHRSCKVFGVCQ